MTMNGCQNSLKESVDMAKLNRIQLFWTFHPGDIGALLLHFSEAVIKWLETEQHREIRPHDKQLYLLLPPVPGAESVSDCATLQNTNN